MEEDNVGTMHDKLSFLGADLLKDTLPSIINGTNESIPQDGTQATFASNISREDERIGIKVSHPQSYSWIITMASGLYDDGR